jgi:AraC-like DNA-binding protein
MVKSAPRCDWAAATANALQVLLGALSGCVPMKCAQDALERAPEPHDESERLLFRDLVSELLLEVVQFGKLVVRRDAVESILRAWPSLRRHPQPVAMLRQALAPRHETLSTPKLLVAEQVHDILERRYADRLLLRDVAEELGVSESKASRCFRIAYGATIHQHLVSVRVRHGLELVVRGAKIEATALAVGFRSKKDFYRAVQQLVGCTPAQFRARGGHDACGPERRPCG